MQNSRPHVILLAYYFPPENAVGGARPFRFYRYLRELGYTCTVLTASEQPADGASDIIWVPDRLRSAWEGTAPAPRTAAAHFERFVRKFIFPGASGVLWSIPVARRCRQIRRREGGRKVVVFATFPPIGVLLAGLLAGRRMPWIADFRDPLPFGPGLRFYPRLSRRVFTLLERAVFRSATAVIANVEGAAAVWRERYPGDRAKLHVIWNGFDPQDLPQAEALPARSARVIIHSGELYEGRNPNLILRSLLRLRKQGQPEACRTNVLLVGPRYNTAELEHGLEKTAADGWVQFRDTVPRQEARRLTAQADGLLLLQPQSAIQVPAKLFEYLAIGRPILALVPRESAVEYILSRAGVPYRCVYSDDEPEAADRTLQDFLELGSEPVRYNPWFEEQFDARRQTAELASILERIT